jgi:precorrin-6B methylase 2
VDLIDYHRKLLADEIRTNAFREAIRKTVKPGDVVLDIGCGSGILSFFACEAGASHVYAIDRGGMAGVAQFLTRHLGFEDRITVFREESTAVELPERADVLVTETIGTIGLDENMLRSVLDARERMLRPGAAIVPRSLTLRMVPVEVTELYDEYIGWLREPRYGFDLRPLQFFASNSILFFNVEKEAHLAQPETIVDIDFATVTSTLARGEARFTASRDAVLHGFLLWFDSTLADGITLSSVNAGETHWAQGFFPLEHPIAVTRGARMDLDFETDDGASWRWRGKAAGEEFDQTTLFSSAPFG